MAASAFNISGPIQSVPLTAINPAPLDYTPFAVLNHNHKTTQDASALNSKLVATLPSTIMQDAYETYDGGALFGSVKSSFSFGQKAGTITAVLSIPEIKTSDAFWHLSDGSYYDKNGTKIAKRISLSTYVKFFLPTSYQNHEFYEFGSSEILNKAYKTSIVKSTHAYIIVCDYPSHLYSASQASSSITETIARQQLINILPPNTSIISPIIFCYIESDGTNNHVFIYFLPNPTSTVDNLKCSVALLRSPYVNSVTISCIDVPTKREDISILYRQTRSLADYSEVSWLRDMDLDDNITLVNNQINALVGQFTALVSQFNGNISAIKGTLASLSSRIDSLTSTMDQFKTQMDRIPLLEKVINQCVPYVPNTSGEFNYLSLFIFKDRSCFFNSQSGTYVSISFPKSITLDAVKLRTTNIYLPYLSRVEISITDTSELFILVVLPGGDLGLPAFHTPKTHPFPSDPLKVVSLKKRYSTLSQYTIKGPLSIILADVYAIYHGEVLPLSTFG